MGKILIKSLEEIELIKSACRVTVKILDEVTSIIKPGISTEAINKFVHQRTLDMGAQPATLNYKGFPKSVLYFSK